MSRNQKMTALGAALLAGVSILSTAGPAASATPATDLASKPTRSVTTITSPLISAGGLFYGNYVNGSSVSSTKLPTFAQALAGRTSAFTYPAPGKTGTITTGGLCVTLPAPGAANAVNLASCVGNARQTFTTEVDGNGLHLVNADGSGLAQLGVSETNVWLGAYGAGATFVTFAVDHTSVDTASRIATVSGHGVPGQTLILNDDFQVVVDTDGTWTAQVPDMRIGVNRIKVEAWTGGNLVGTQYANGDIDVAQLNATSSFGSRVTDDATVSGSAEPGATVIVRDATGREKGRATADDATGRYSLTIAAPNTAGVAAYAVTQVVSGLETAPTALNIDFGAELAVTAPINDLIVLNGSVSFSGTGAIGALVTVHEKGAVGILGNATVLANGRWHVPGIAVDRFEHEFVVTQTAPGNNVTSQSLTINPGLSNVVAPTAAVTVPTTVTQQATIGGAGTTGAVITVMSGGLQIGNPITVANGTWSMPVPSSIGAGSHAFTVTQTIDGKAAGTASVTHDFGAAVTATSTLTGSTATITGTGANGSRVVVTEGGRQVGTATVTGGTYTIPVTGVTTGNHTYTVTQTAPGNIVTTATTTASRASAITVTNPANPAAGYTPNNAFTFTGTAPRTAGTLTIRNFQGTLIATVPVDPATGAWSWTRSNMGTSTWKLTFITNEGAANQESYTLPDFAPSAAQALKFTDPTDPAAGYVANTAFTFRGIALPGAKVVLTNFTGVVLANLTADANGNWSWTRANMGTSTWKITATADKGAANQQTVTLGDFAPRP
jgi:hypothetical protein